MDSANKISVGSLIRLRECERKKHFSDLALNSKELERRFHVNHVLDVLKQCMKQGDNHDKAIEKMQQALKDGYHDEWFALGREKLCVLEKDEKRLQRLASFLYSKSAKVVDLNVPYVLELASAVSYRGETFRTIVGRADMILEKDGKYEAIMFSQKEPQYSNAARIDAHKPINALELICMKLGLESRYPGVTCAIYYLKNKDDKSMDFKPFEHKAGKNIIAQSYEGFSMDDLLEKLYYAVSLSVKVNCEDCVMAKVCRFPRAVRTVEPDEEPAASEKKADCSYTSEQEKVIHHVDGPMNVIAVPGAGKTFTLVERMLYLIREKGVKPSKILFATFTKKACEEIKERVMRALGTTDEDELPTIYTLNALGYQILKDNPALVGKRVKLAETTERLAIIRDVLDLVPTIRGVSYDGLYMKFGLIRRLEKEFQVLAERGEDAWKEGSKFEDQDGVLRAYHMYVELFKERELVTYDEQISLCNELFERKPELARLYSRVFQYIMIDEFQDVSEENVKMVYAIAKHHNNIVVVGDDDQSIYSFRGGSNKYLLDFAQEFPNAKTVIMRDNFRSTDTILAAAGALIENNQVRMEKELVAHSENAFKPILMRDFVTERLPGLIKQILSKGYRLGDIAILSRYNKTLLSVEDALSSYYKCNAPKDYLIDDPVFMMLLDIQRLMFAPKDTDMSVYRLFSWLGCEESLHKDRKDVPLLDNILSANGLPKMDLSDPECTRVYDGIDTSEPVKYAARVLFESLKEIQYAKDIGNTLDVIVDKFFHVTNHPVVRVLRDMVDERAVDSFHALYSLMQDMCIFGADKRVGYPSSKDAINLLTAHDAKGKEYPVVIVYSAEEFADTEEERRLFYVALTRAKKSLFVTESMYQHAPLIRECEACMSVF